MGVGLRVDVADRDEAVGGVDVVALAVELAEEAVVGGHAARIPSSVTAAARDAHELADLAAHEPRRVVVAVPRPGRSTSTTSSRPSFERQWSRHAARDCSRRRALRSLLHLRRTGSSAAVFVPGRGEYGKTCSFVRRASRDDAERVRERALVLGREADDDVGREVEVGRALEPAEIRRDGVAAAHRAQHAVVARLQRHV